MQKFFLVFFLIFSVFSLAGCGNDEIPLEDEQIEEVEIEQEDQQIEEVEIEEEGEILDDEVIDD